MQYKDIVITDHAKERMSKRSLSIEGVYHSIHQPDKVIYKNNDTAKFIKKYQNRLYHIVAKKLENEKKWLVISVWVRGEEDNPDLIWRIISLPFKIVWELTKKLFKLIV